MRIVHLATTLNDGAGIAAWRQHQALRQLGVESRFLVAQPPDFSSTENVAVVGLPELSAAQRLARKFARIWSPARTWAHERARIDARVPPRYEAFSLPFAPFRPEDHPWLASADVVHLHWTAGFVDYPRFFERVRQPIVWTLHDQSSYLGGFHYETDAPLSPQLTDLDARCFALKRRCLQSGRHAVVGNSEWNTSRALAAGTYPSTARFETIYYPLDLTAYSPRDPATVRTALGLSPSAFFVGFASASLANQRKGLADLLAALRELPSERNVPTTILSFGRQPAPEIVSTLPHPWIHLGFIGDDRLRAAAYAAMDVFVAPSRAEAFGQTAIEAMACEVPVIATAVGGLAEAVDCGRCGILVPPASPAELLKALSGLRTDPVRRRTLASAGRVHVTSRHDPAGIAARQVRLYESLLGSRPRP